VSHWRKAVEMDRDFLEKQSLETNAPTLIVTFVIFNKYLLRKMRYYFLGNHRIFRWKSSTGLYLRNESFLSKCRINFDGFIHPVGSHSQQQQETR
jgi:hypothetical protein